jgi:hypothetical protein
MPGHRIGSAKTSRGTLIELDLWDWAAGRNFLTAMSDALDRCDRVVALFSAAYFDRSRYATEEWSAAMLHQPDMEQGRLVPVRLEEVAPKQMPAVLRALIFYDLFGVGADQARRRLLEAVKGPRPPRQLSYRAGPGHAGCRQELWRMLQAPPQELLRPPVRQGHAGPRWVSRLSATGSWSNQ